MQQQVALGVHHLHVLGQFAPADAERRSGNDIDSLMPYRERGGFAAAPCSRNKTRKTPEGSNAHSVLKAIRLPPSSGCSYRRDVNPRTPTIVHRGYIDRERAS